MALKRKSTNMQADINKQVEERTKEYIMAGREWELRKAELQNRVDGQRRQLEAAATAQAMDRQQYESNHANLGAQLKITEGERNQAVAALQYATGFADEDTRKMIQEAAEAMADWTKKEEQYRQMIKALEDQVKDIANVYNKQWVDEKNEVVSQLFQKVNDGTRCDCTRCTRSNGGCGTAEGHKRKRTTRTKGRVNGPRTNRRRHCKKEKETM